MFGVGINLFTNEGVLSVGLCMPETSSLMPGGFSECIVYSLLVMISQGLLVSHLYKVQVVIFIQ